jgi:hypothetical protein
MQEVKVKQVEASLAFAIATAIRFPATAHLNIACYAPQTTGLLFECVHNDVWIARRLRSAAMICGVIIVAQFVAQAEPPERESQLRPSKPSALAQVSISLASDACRWACDTMFPL